jgi:hypothetical protein
LVVLAYGLRIRVCVQPKSTSAAIPSLTAITRPRPYTSSSLPRPLELGEDALRALRGFIQEGRPEPDDVDADVIELYGSHVRASHRPDLAGQEADPAKEGRSVPVRYRSLSFAVVRVCRCQTLMSGGRAPLDRSEYPCSCVRPVTAAC